MTASKRRKSIYVELNGRDEQREREPLKREREKGREPFRSDGVCVCLCTSVHFQRLFALYCIFDTHTLTFDVSMLQSDERFK